MNQPNSSSTMLPRSNYPSISQSIIRQVQEAQRVQLKNLAIKMNNISIIQKWCIAILSMAITRIRNPSLRQNCMMRGTSKNAQPQSRKASSWVGYRCSPMKHT
ncbi:hypothetical protein FGO68_gene12512 [Halteria grandinella]|uniref:Uncharacterized protein n=1 Tax=Halteria grandinella TaxID=5974 RepID=A0A8J8TAC1_HALGN|nr:hypothetical protein FGO68_gene12512 [Halteria grandinella]